MHSRFGHSATGTTVDFMPWIGRMRNFFRCVRGHAYDLRQSPACRRAPVPAPASAARIGRAHPQAARANTEANRTREAIAISTSPYAPTDIHSGLTA